MCLYLFYFLANNPLFTHRPVTSNGLGTATVTVIVTGTVTATGAGRPSMVRETMPLLKSKSRSKNDAVREMTISIVENESSGNRCRPRDDNFDC